MAQIPLYLAIMVFCMVSPLNILTFRAARPPIGCIPLILRYCAATIACRCQWIPFCIKPNRYIGGVIVGAELAGLTPQAICTSRKTIKQGFFMPYCCITVKTMHSLMRGIFRINSILHINIPSKEKQLRKQQPAGMPVLQVYQFYLSCCHLL